MTHICVSKLTTTDSDNGLSPRRRQAIIWTNAGILLIRPLGRNFGEILIAIETFSFKKRHLKISSVKWRPFCLGLNILNVVHRRLVFLEHCDSRLSHLKKCSSSFCVQKNVEKISTLMKINSYLRTRDQIKVCEPGRPRSGPSWHQARWFWRWHCPHITTWHSWSHLTPYEMNCVQDALRCWIVHK